MKTQWNPGTGDVDATKAIIRDIIQHNESASSGDMAVGEIAFLGDGKFYGRDNTEPFAFAKEEDVLAISGVISSGATGERPTSGNLLFHNTTRKKVEQIEAGAWIRDFAALNANTINIFVSSSGNDSNDGLSSEFPKLTIQGALDSLPEILGSNVTITLANGTYAGAFLGRSGSHGASVPTISLVGNVGTPSSVIINSKITIKGYISLSCSGLTLKPGADVSLQAVGSGSTITIANCIVNSSLLAEFGAAIYVGTGCSFSGDYAGYPLLQSQHGGLIDVSTPTPSISFASGQPGTAILAQYGGRINLPSGVTITNCLFGIYASYNSLVCCAGAISITEGDNNGYGISSRYCSVVDIAGNYTLNGGGLYTYALHVMSSGIIYIHGTVSAIATLVGMYLERHGLIICDSSASISCINNADAVGIKLSGCSKASLAAITLTGAGVGVGIGASGISHLKYLSATFAGTWGANTVISANSIASTT